MNRLWNFALALILGVFLFSVAGAEKEVMFGGELFSSWYYDMSDSLTDFGNRSYVRFDNYNRFQVTRAYLTGKAKLSDRTYGRISSDVNPSYNYIRLKYGYVGWAFLRSEKLDLGANMGLVENPYIYNMDEIWGRRYISMTPGEMSWNQDAPGMQSSADFGLSFWGKFGEDGKVGKAFISFFNGPGYTETDENNPTKDVDFTIFLNPLNAQPGLEESKIGFQFSTGKVNAYNDSSDIEDYYKMSILSFMGDLRYRKLFNIGLEYNGYTSPYILDVLNTGLYYFDFDDSSDVKVSSLSIFGALWFGELMPDSRALQTLDLFFRYVMLDPDTDDHDDIGYPSPAGTEPYEVKATQMIIGLECAPVEGFKSSLNFQSDKIKDRGAGLNNVTNSYLYLNMGLWF
ncbi:MAG: hypothetical protein JSW64_09410 [Candidatus Zixiibacteriota bacterium]|nr:MAG: hypothetical protein JSW64_09410 [candidate division Zixibacteria bacterium]